MKKWSEEEIFLLKDNYGKISNYDLIKLFPNKKQSGIYHKANRLGLVGNRSLTNRKNHVNDDFFSIPNPICSYIAGFIAADGSISKNLCKLTISQKDPEVLNNIKKYIDFNGPIVASYTRGSVCHHMAIASQKIVSDLYINYNITHNKSLSLKPPLNLDIKNNLCYIVGMIDGDGCIYKYREKPTHKEYLKLSIINTIWITKWIKEILGCGFTRNNLKGYKPETGTYTCACNQAFDIINKLRSIEELDSLRLSRKWNKILELNR